MSHVYEADCVLEWVPAYCLIPYVSDDINARLWGNFFPQTILGFRVTADQNTWVFDVHLFVLIPLVPFIKMPFLKPVFLDRQVREMLDMYQFPGDDTSGKLCWSRQSDRIWVWLAWQNYVMCNHIQTFLKWYYPVFIYWISLFPHMLKMIVLLRKPKSYGLTKWPLAMFPH